LSDIIVIDKLGSYGAALRHIGFSGRHEKALRSNNRAQNSYQPFDDAKQQRAFELIKAIQA
jgi:putative transposase